MVANEVTAMIFETPVIFHNHGVPIVGRIMRNVESLQAVEFLRSVAIRSFASVAGWYYDPPSLAPAYRDGNERAGMHFRLDYYALPERGAVPERKNEMAEIPWFYWLTYDGLAAADAVSTPSLFVHSNDCVFPDHARQVHARIKGPKKLVWASGGQTDFYDQPAHVGVACDAITRWFGQTLQRPEVAAS